MNFRITPLWWPLLVGTAPLSVPLMLLKYQNFLENKEKATIFNRNVMDNAIQLDIPETEEVKILPIVEEKTVEGFKGDAGVSYLISADAGQVLFDVGFGPQNDVFEYNATKKEISFDFINAIVISHLHLDHMGGLAASRAQEVRIPRSVHVSEDIPCFLPDTASVRGYTGKVVKRSEILPGGAVTTGPLARSLFFLGFTLEQALLYNVKNKGLVVITGCGHQTIPKLIGLVQNISHLPIYAICGGMHFPITNGRGNKIGIQCQRFVGTGKPPWAEVNDSDLSRTIASINSISPEKVLLSAHDSCDHSLRRLAQELDADTEVLLAGQEYIL